MVSWGGCQDGVIWGSGPRHQDINTIIPTISSRWCACAHVVHVHHGAYGAIAYTPYSLMVYGVHVHHAILYHPYGLPLVGWRWCWRW